jgi:hypothetical protein
MWESGKPPKVYFWLLGLALTMFAVAVTATTTSQPGTLPFLALGTGLGLLVGTLVMWFAVSAAARRKR